MWISATAYHTGVEKTLSVLNKGRSYIIHIIPKRSAKGYPI